MLILRILTVINYHEIILSLNKNNDIALLIMRAVPSYYMFINHGWSKITSPAKWNTYGTFFTKYIGGFLDFTNISFGFMAAFAESICSIMGLVGLLTHPAAFLLAFTMLVAAMHHIIGTGSPDNAWIYFSIITAIFLLGPVMYSSYHYLFVKQTN
jgi:DoxX.